MEFGVFYQLPCAEDQSPAPEGARLPPARRVARVNKANPAAATPSPNGGDSATNVDDGKRGESASPESVRTAPPPIDAPMQSVTPPDPTDLGIAPPALLDDVAPPPTTPAPRRGALARPTGTAIVPVHVTAGLRIGKFGKTGRPEQVVSVRGRGTGAMPARPGRSRSIEFLARRTDDPRPV